jgi:hypothetical protein
MTLCVTLAPGQTAQAEEIDRLTREFLREMRESQLGAEMAHNNPAEQGAKSIEMVEIGKILVTLLPVAIPKLVGLLYGWLRRSKDRHIRLKMPNGFEIEVTGDTTVAEIQTLLEGLGVSESSPASSI